jgi:hypothetical protein
MEIPDFSSVISVVSVAFSNAQRPTSDAERSRVRTKLMVQIQIGSAVPRVKQTTPKSEAQDAGPIGVWNSVF